MEPPVSPTADNIRDEKFKVLSALRPMDRNRVMHGHRPRPVRRGSIAGKPVPGYRDEPNVNPESNTETYAAVKFYIDNWRWADVPFFLRSAASVWRAKTPRSPSASSRFRTGSSVKLGDTIDNNVLVMKIQPEEGISLRFSAKVPGPKMHIRVGVDGLQLRHRIRRCVGRRHTNGSSATRCAAMRRCSHVGTPCKRPGDSDADPRTLVGRTDETFPNYAAGGQGPASSERLLAADGREWRKI